MNRTTLRPHATGLTLGVMLTLLLGACPAAHAGEDEEDKVAVEKQATILCEKYAKVDAGQRQATAARLAALGPKAAPAIVACLKANKFPKTDGWPLVGVLDGFGEAGLEPLMAVASDQSLDRTCHQAMFALAERNVDQADRFLLGYVPRDKNTAEVHVMTLAGIPGDQAVRLLADYLLSPHEIVSTRAKQMLVKRAKEDGPVIAAELTRVLGTLEAGRNEDEKKHMRINIMRTATSLPDSNAASFLADALEGNNDKSREDAVEALREKVKLVLLDQVREAMAVALEENTDTKLRVDILKLCAASGDEQMVPMVASMLEVADRQVRLKTCEALMRLKPDVRHGRSPEKWLDWYRNEY